MSWALALVKSELLKRHTCTDLRELRSYLGLQITRDRARRTITLTQSHVVQQVLQRFGFTWSSAQATPLATGHSLSAPPSDESVEPSGPYPELVGCLITSGLGLVLGGRGDVVLTGHSDASWVDDQTTQRSSQGYTFSLGSGSVSWRSTRSSSVLGSTCEAEIYATALAAQELRWLTYLLTDLGERPRSPPVLYVDNKAAIALCQKHRTKHIALRYFLARELQQRGQLRLTYVATRANSADIFTKALPPGDHQRFCTFSSNGSPGTTPTPPPAFGLQTEEGTATRPRASSSETPANQSVAFDPDMMEKFFSFMSFYEQHQQGAPAQSNNSHINAKPMSLDGSSYARGNQQQRPAFAPYEPLRGSVNFMPHPQPASGQEKTLDALQVQSQFAHVLKLQTTRPFDGKDFFTWSFEFELMMEGAQILGFFDGSLPYPTHGTLYDKQQYMYQSMMAYTIILRNITPSQQQNIRSYRGYGNSA
ncbi:unnamed protein product [Closterium sp. NIES-54]